MIPPLRLCFTGPLILALFLAVEAPLAKYTFIVNVLGGWLKKRNNPRKEGLTQNKATPAQPQKPKDKLAKALLVFKNRNRWTERRSIGLRASVLSYFTTTIPPKPPRIYA